MSQLPQRPTPLPVPLVPDKTEGHDEEHIEIQGFMMRLYDALLESKIFEPSGLNSATGIIIDVKTGAIDVTRLPIQEIMPTAYIMDVNGALGPNKPALYADIQAYLAANGFTPGGGGGGTPVNQLPVAEAGPDVTITLPTSSVTRTGTASDIDGTIASVLWTKLSGPNVGAISSPNSTTTNFTGMTTVGEYVFQLVATDDKGGKSVADTFKITVLAEAVVGGVNPVTYIAQEDNPGFPTTEKVAGQNKYTTPVSEGTDNTFNNNSFMGSLDNIPAGKNGAIYMAGDSLWAQLGGSLVSAPRYHTSTDVKFKFYGNYDDMAGGTEAVIYNENGRQGALRLNPSADYRYNKTGANGATCKWALEKFTNGSWSEVYVCAYTEDATIYAWGSLQKRGGVNGSYLNNPRFEVRA